MKRTEEKQLKYTSIRDCVEKIARGEFDPAELSRDDRQFCVEFLRYEMRYPIRQIAKLLKIRETMVNSDLRLITIGMAKCMEHGEISAELVGTLMAQLRTNYDMALEKRDVSGANKSTEMLKELAQDLGHITKAGDTINHKGLDILALALGANKDDE
jgi:hypothetical protein